jgi:hypothetical protein
MNNHERPLIRAKRPLQKLVVFHSIGLWMELLCKHIKKLPFFLLRLEIRMAEFRQTEMWRHD